MSDTARITANSTLRGLGNRASYNDDDMKSYLRNYFANNDDNDDRSSFQSNYKSYDMQPINSGSNSHSRQLIEIFCLILLSGFILLLIREVARLNSQGGNSSSRRQRSNADDSEENNYSLMMELGIAALDLKDHVQNKLKNTNTNNIRQGYEIRVDSLNKIQELRKKSYYDGESRTSAESLTREIQDSVTNKRNTLIAKNESAEYMKKKGHLKEARRLYEENLAAQREMLGPKHSDTIATIACLALLLTEQGNVVQAKAYFKEAISACREELGPRHRATLTAINNYAGFLRDQGRYEHAAVLYKDAISGARLTYGPEHAQTLEYKRKLAELREKRRK